MSYDDAEIRDFGQRFADFLTYVVEPVRAGGVGRESLVDRIAEFLAADPSQLPVVTEPFNEYEHATVQIAVDELLDRPGVRHELIGVAGGARMFQSFTEILQLGRAVQAFWLGSVDYAAVPVAADEERACVQFGIYLIDTGDQRLAVLMRGQDTNRGPDVRGGLEVLAPTTDAARSWLAELRELKHQRNILRGQVFSFEPDRFGHGAGPMRFLPRPDVRRSDVIMPVGLLERVERQIVGIAEHRERLSGEGRHLRRGVLLYGPPGTGKTHTVRYLTAALREFTAIQLTGPSIGFVPQACELAKHLQPSLIVLEDCDLVAEDRSFTHGASPLLFTILDQMDGLGSDADVAFLLTTNRVEVIEKALAQRPGRVDLAVELPLPDATGRRRLLDLYGGGIEMSEEDVAAVVEQTDGVPASFVKELVRRATLLAAVRGDASTQARDVREAVDELMSDQDALTRRLLGDGGEAPLSGEHAPAGGEESSGWFAYAPAPYVSRRIH